MKILKCLRGYSLISLRVGASEDGDPYPPVPFNILREGLVHVFREPLTSTDWQRVESKGRGRARARVRALWGFSGWRGNETEVLSFPSLKRQVAPDFVEVGEAGIAVDDA